MKLKRKKIISTLVIVGILGGVTFAVSRKNSSSLVSAALVPSPFIYSFNAEGVLEESPGMNMSRSPYWWLDSGGEFHIENGIGKTVSGNLPSTSKWHHAYNLSSPSDSDQGLHPQNIFRLLTRSVWQNFEEEVYFKITRLNLSDSLNRNESNGVLLFSRYQNSDNLYYAGLRVDGFAVVKKKVNGAYSVLGLKSVYPLKKPYDRLENPNLLPLNTWLGLRSEISTAIDGVVSIRLFLDREKKGEWELILESFDKAERGDSVILNPGYAGLRTDFMDVEFDSYVLTKL